MNNQELEAKFNLIGDPIVRAVVRHLYKPEFNDALYFAETAANVAYWAVDWINFKKEVCDMGVPEKLVDNPNYSFTPEELEQVMTSYPELFNSDGSLKDNIIPMSDDIQFKRPLNTVPFDRILCAVVTAIVPRYSINEMSDKADEIVDVASKIYIARNKFLGVK